MKAYFFLLVLFSFAVDSFAQNKQLSIYGLNDFKGRKEFIVKDSLSALAEGNRTLQELYAASYLSATIDSISIDQDKIGMYVSQGDLYKWLKLSKGNLDEESSSQIDLSGRLFLNRPFNAKQLSELFKRTIQYFENNGYPFASVRLDSFHLNPENEISAALKIEKNQFYQIDSILLKGSSGISRKYLLNYLELEEGQAFNEEKIKNISKRIQEIPFIAEDRRNEVQYFEDGVKIILYTRKKDASRFDGVLGLLTNEDDGRIELTGDIDLNLINSFNRGENIGLNWRKLQGNSQDLNLDFAYPFFFNTPFGIDFNFKLFKRDTTFLDLTTRMGINYTFKRGEWLTLFLENKSSSLLSKRSLVASNTGTLPALGDVSINSFGIQYDLNRLDYLYNPTKGLSLSSSFAVGRKKLNKIRALEEENPTIYDGVVLNTTQFQGNFKLNYFIPLAKRSTFLLANQSATNYAESLYQNELLRIGGLKILRGFDEESINASTYSIFTLEYRFLLDRNSYFSLFSDGGYYENNNISSYTNDTPFGMGAGISFETTAGIFTFNYAIGKQMGNPVEFRAAKIHFGFVNFF